MAEILASQKEGRWKGVFFDSARRAVTKVGWDPQIDLELQNPAPGQQGWSRSYGSRLGRIRLSYAPELPRRLAALREVARKDGGRDVGFHLEAVAAARVYMSAGSYQICPSSADDYAEILEAVGDGLRSVGASEPEVLEFTRPVASFFIASVVAAVSAIEGHDPRVFRRGWILDQIVSVPEDAALPSHRTLFSNVQLRLWSDEADVAAALRAHFCRPFDALEFETDRGIAILLDSFDLVGETGDGLAWAGEAIRDRVADQLIYGWRLWPIKAFQFAELLGPYVVGDASRQGEPPGTPARQDRREEQRPGAGPPSARAQARRARLQRHQPGQRAVSPVELQPTQGEPIGEPAEPFAERFRLDPHFRRQVLSAGIGRGVDPFRYFAGFEVLDALYRERATEVRVEGRTQRRPGSALDIAHMERRRLDGGMPGLDSIDWGATRFGPGGRIELYRKSLPITDATPARSELRGFPDLLFVVDSSGSMAWDPRASCGPYDSLLRAVYSVLAYLEGQRMAEFMSFAVINFSAQTLKAPWTHYGELDVVKRLLFRHQGGGTRFDSSSLQEMVRSASDTFACLMVTDGQIHNIEDVIRSVRGLLAEGNGFALIQIGAETGLASQLREMGVPVHVIADHGQLEGLCLDYARSFWGAGGGA